MPARFCAFAGARVQRELADEQYPSASFNNRATLGAFLTGKETLAHQLGREPFEIVRSVGGFDPKEHDEPGINCSDYFMIDGDTRGFDPLDDSSHAADAYLDGNGA